MAANQQVNRKKQVPKLLNRLVVASDSHLGCSRQVERRSQLWVQQGPAQGAGGQRPIVRNQATGNKLEGS